MDYLKNFKSFFIIQRQKPWKSIEVKWIVISLFLSHSHHHNNNNNHFQDGCHLSIMIPSLIFQTSFPKKAFNERKKRGESKLKIKKNFFKAKNKKREKR